MKAKAFSQQYKFTLQGEQFTLSTTVSKNATKITMKVENHILYTSRLPLTSVILGERLPSIFKCKCFNDSHKNFQDESKDTEIGHLFEHILLEYLCMEKLERGFEKAEYSGVTNWNWQKDAVGTFHINISIGIDELEIIARAFQKAVELLKSIVLNDKRTGGLVLNHLSLKHHKE